MENEINYREEIIKHIIECESDFENYSLIERYRAAQKAMELSRGYCAQRFNLDPKKIYTNFIHGGNMGGISGGNIQRDGFSAYALTTKKVVNAKSVLAFYRTSLHEMDHLDKINNKNKTDPTTITHYKTNNGKVNKFLWLSSPSEASAEEFAFRESRSLVREAVIKSRGKVSPAKFVGVAFKSLASKTKHTLASAVYHVGKPFLHIEERTIGEKLERTEAEKKELSESLHVYTMHDVRSVAGFNSEIFNEPSFVAHDKSSKTDNSKEVNDCFETYFQVRSILDMRSSRREVPTPQDQLSLEGNGGLMLDSKDVSSMDMGGME